MTRLVQDVMYAARTFNVVWLVLREVLLLVAGGVGIGLPAALALSKLVRAQLFGVEPDDPPSIAAATLLLAGYVPARRASGYGPVRVLRYE